MAGNPSVTITIKRPVSRDPNGIGRWRGRHGIGRRRRGHLRNLLNDAHRAGVSRCTLVVYGAIFVVSSVAQRTAGEGAGSAADKCAAQRISAAAIVSDNRTGDRAEGAARDGTLLSVRTCANAAAEECGAGQS